MGAVAVGAILIALLLAITAAMVWQASRVPHTQGETLYLVDEAIDFVHRGLPEAQAARMTRDDVRTVLEWSMYHSQVVAARLEPDAPVLGGPDAGAFVRERAETHGRTFEDGDIDMVLELEMAYLVSIGAIGAPVEEHR